MVSLQSVIERATQMSANGKQSSADRVAEFSKLVNDLADQIFERDEDGESVLNIRISDAKRWTVYDFYHDRRVDLYNTDVDDGTALKLLSDASRTAERMISTAKNILAQVHSAAELRASVMKSAEESKNDFDGLRALLSTKRFDEFATEASRLIEKYDPPRYAGVGEAAKTPYNRQGNYRKVPEELMLIIDDYGLELPKSNIEPALIEINALLDIAEPLVGLADFNNAMHEVREAIYRHQYGIGRRALGPINVRYNRMSEDNRVIKRLAQQGKRIVSNDTV